MYLGNCTTQAINTAKVLSDYSPQSNSSSPFLQSAIPSQIFSPGRHANTWKSQWWVSGGHVPEINNSIIGQSNSCLFNLYVLKGYTPTRHTYHESTRLGLFFFLNPSIHTPNLSLLYCSSATVGPDYFHWCCFFGGGSWTGHSRSRNNWLRWHLGIDTTLLP